MLVDLKPISFYKSYDYDYCMGRGRPRKKQQEQEDDMMNDYLNERDDINELTEEQLSQDLYESQRTGSYASEIMPDDVYKYKVMRLIPNSETDFRGLIDKDVVLANLRGAKPNINEVGFLAETIDLVKNILVTEKTFYVLDEENKPILIQDSEGKKSFQKTTKTVFDPHFMPIISALTAKYKFYLSGSRAMGSDREAILDKSSFVKKDIQRLRRSKKSGVAGTGEDNN